MNAQHDRSIVTAIQKMAGTFSTDPVTLLTAKIISVDEGVGTCICEAVTGDSTTNVEGVELQTTISDGILIIPTIGSEVKVLFSKYTTPFIVQYSDVEKLYIAGNLIQFNSGNFGGLAKVQGLLAALNKIETKINILTTWAATVTPPLTTPPLTLTTITDIEDSTITH